MARQEELPATVAAHEWLLRALITSMPDEQHGRFKKAVAALVNDTSALSIREALPDTHKELRRICEELHLL